ncbi:MAG: deoxyribonuclease IV [Elusimicrobiota bacterium]
MRIGVHCPISDGFKKSIQYILEVGGNTIQIFSGNPRGWDKNTISNIEAGTFKTLREEHNIYPLIVHAPYLINIASPNEKIRKKSIKALKNETKRCDILNADYLILHPGNFLNSTLDKGIENHINSLNQIFKQNNFKVNLLIENTPGQGTSIGANLDNLLYIRDKLIKKIDFCLDTAHGFQAGYKPIELVTHKISKYAKVIHINDSKTSLGSRKDLHQHIGKGKIGIKGFKLMINYPDWRNIPFILETPWNTEMDKKNIDLIKKLAS